MCPLYGKILCFASVILCTCSCANLERKVFVKQVDFEVDPKANRGNPFVCHIVVPYSSDLVIKLHGMDAQTYFTQLSELQRLYKDKLEIFSYDIIPGKSKLKQSVSPRSRTKAFGAYIFAKYTVNGKFAERLGLNKKILVKFEEYKMLIYDGSSNEPQFDDKRIGSCPVKDLPKTDTKAEPECVECPPGYEYAAECDNGTKTYLPEKKDNNTKEECTECPEGYEYINECDDGTVNYIPYQYQPTQVNTTTKQTSNKTKSTQQKSNVHTNGKLQSVKR